MKRTRIVQLLRVLLPLAALVLLSTLFLFSGPKEEGSSLPYAEVTPESLATRPVMTQPTYAGVARDGTEIQMSAESANPGGQTGRSSAETVNLTLRDPKGVTTDLVAGAGEMADGVIRLSDGVTMTTSTGWTLTSKAFVAQLQEGSLTSTDQIDAQAPFGELTAQEMALRTLPDGSGQRVLDLKGGVRMIYRP